MSPTIYQNKTKVPGKSSKFEFNYKERQVVLPVHKLFEHDNWQDLLKFSNKIHLPI